MDEKQKVPGRSDNHGQNGQQAIKILFPVLLVGLMIISVLLLVLTGTWFRKSAFDPPKADLTVTIGINHSLKSAPLVIAERMGFFSREGIALSLIMEPSAVSLLEKLSEKTLDMVCAPEQLLAFRAIEKDDFLILAVLNRNRSQELILNTAWGIESVSGLKGRRIALQQDSASEYFLYRKLLYHGVDINDVELVDMEPGMIPETLAAGGVDAAITWPPFSNRIRQRLGAEALRFNAHMGRDMYWLLVAEKNWCRANLSAMESFLAALQAAYVFMANDPRQAMSICSDFFLFPVERVKKEWHLYDFDLALPQSLLFAMEQEARWRQARLNLTGPLPDYFERIEYRPLKRLMPDKVSLIH